MATKTKKPRKVAPVSTFGMLPAATPEQARRARLGVWTDEEIAAAALALTNAK